MFDLFEYVGIQHEHDHSVLLWTRISRKVYTELEPIQTPTTTKRDVSDVSSFHLRSDESRIETKGGERVGGQTTIDLQDCKHTPLSRIRNVRHGDTVSVHDVRVRRHHKKQRSERVIFIIINHNSAHERESS